MARPSFIGSFGFRPRALGPWLAGMIGLGAVGCDSMSFTPPRPPELSDPAAAPSRVEAAAPQGLRAIDVILAPRGTEDIEYLRVATRVQAGLDRVRAQVVEVPGGGPEVSAWSERAAAIAASVAQNPQAIAIEAPADPTPELSKAAAEARGRGVTILALGRSLDDGKTEASASAARQIVVAPEPFGPSAETLVADAIRNARNGKIDPKGGALVVINTTSDTLVGDRVEALRAALKAAGIEAVEVLRFAGPNDDVRAKLTEALKAHPKIALILTTDFVGLTAADKLVAPLQPTHPFVIAGYSGDENHARTQTNNGMYAAVGLYSADRLVRKGISVAADLQRGATVPDRVEVRVVMTESNPEAGLPHATVEEVEPRATPAGKAQGKPEAKAEAEPKPKD